MKILAFVAAALAASPVAASTLTHSSLFTPFGGLVVEAQGLNGNWLLSQTSPSELNKGAPRGDPEFNDFYIGQQAGFSDELLGQLGGGFQSFSVRLTVFDGDNDPGNFDEDENFLRINGATIGNFSDVVTTTTDGDGNILFGVDDGIGFGGDETDTGIFTLEEDSILASLFASLSLTNTLVFEIDKIDESGNFFDFTSPSRIPYYADVGFGPTVSAVPLPAGVWFLLAGVGGIGLLRRSRPA